jgi:2-polyprenyl-3-methyl-5-hydroxy-6-metoxy-1,4-benzoquinol methylase
MNTRLNARDPGALAIWHLYSGSGIGSRSFVWLRWTLTPYWQMASLLPSRGRLLDVASGHGLLSLALAAQSETRDILGIDHDPERVRAATAAASLSGCRSRVRFEVRNLADALAALPKESFAGVAMIDMLHYFDRETQRKLLSQAIELLVSGGTLLIREVDPSGGLVSRWNRLYETLATRTGFTRTTGRSLHFRQPSEWSELLEEHGLDVRIERSGSSLFSDILYIGTRRT